LDPRCRKSRSDIPVPQPRHRQLIAGDRSGGLVGALRTATLRSMSNGAPLWQEAMPKAPRQGVPGKQRHGPDKQYDFAFEHVRLAGTQARRCYFWQRPASLPVRCTLPDWMSIAIRQGDGKRVVVRALSTVRSWQIHAHREDQAVVPGHGVFCLVYDATPPNRRNRWRSLLLPQYRAIPAHDREQGIPRMERGPR
jgi:hypothetical protein